MYQPYKCLAGSKHSYTVPLGFGTMAKHLPHSTVLSTLVVPVSAVLVLYNSLLNDSCSAYAADLDGAY